ncbi:MAG: spore protease YyaC [Syntrophomonadaceae bacterium]|nr:spore protease YyaC [Syntrophomonadaceae bacterium]
MGRLSIVNKPGIVESSWHYEDPTCAEKIRDAYCNLLLTLNPGLARQVVIMCIGTDRSTGDSLGPLVGTRLLQYGMTETSVLGSLEYPVHAVNLEQTLARVSESWDQPFIVAVDACLGRTDRIGYVSVKPGVLRPGTALKKELPPVGELHISGVVNVAGFLEHIVLQNTRLGTVFKMADTIARGIWLAHLSLTE